LEAYIQSMLAYLEKGEVELADFAYTLQVGRDEMPARLALVASSIEELKQKFGEILKGERPADSPTTDLSKLVEQWVSGAKIDWRSLHTSDAPRRIAVPTYPFAKERHWFPSPKTETALPPPKPASVARLHPLVHTNMSTLGQQSYRSML